jgi:RNA polymerase sigma-70 factor (ECF subfamily)
VTPDRSGNPDRASTPLEDAVARLYGDLREIAERQLRDERANHTLQPTALVHEAYLRLLDQRNVAWTNPAQALGLAAQTMRRILVDHARARETQKRGGAQTRVALDSVDTPSPESEATSQIDVLALETALVELAEIDATRARIVELRFYGGLTNAEVSDVTGVPKRSVDREWAVARAWLFRRLHGGA